MFDKLDKLKVLGYYLHSRRKDILALFSLLLCLVILHIWLPYYFEQVVPQEVEYCEMQIISVEHGAYSNHEYTIFTVEQEQGKFYTLPKVSTNTVRTYNIGDTLPVILLENGTIKVDINAITSR